MENFLAFLIFRSRQLSIDSCLEILKDRPVSDIVKFSGHLKLLIVKVGLRSKLPLGRGGCGIFIIPFSQSK